MKYYQPYIPLTISGDDEGNALRQAEADRINRNRAARMVDGREIANRMTDLLRPNPFQWHAAEQLGNPGAQAAPPFRRAAQDAICKTCGKEFRKHHHEKFGEGDFALELFKLCDGEWVKL